MVTEINSQNIDEIKKAREEGRLHEVLPSGTILTADLKGFGEMPLVVGRDETCTYLIMRSKRKTERQHAVKRADVASMLDEIEAEVEDGLGYQHQKWKEYVVEGMPKAKLRNRKNQKEEDMANELMIVFPEDGWCYFKTRQETTGAALGEFYNACERAGINMDNVRRPVKTELRVVLDKKKPQDAVNCSDVIAMLDEIKTEVEDGLGYQHQKWKEYVVEEMPEARPRKKREERRRNRKRRTGPMSSPSFSQETAGVTSRPAREQLFLRLMSFMTPVKEQASIWTMSGGP